MRDVLDMHTHTLVSGHAYNTMMEMVQAAKDKNLELLGITDHAPKMPGGPHLFHFMNMKIIPREINGMKVMFGTELNIMDYKGTVDLPDKILKQMDVSIASLHLPCFKPGTKEENTEAILNAIKNPYVNIIGHPDDGRYPVDYLAIVQAAKEYHTLLEVNNHSLDNSGSRENAEENDIKMLELCKEYRVPVIMGSDAHCIWDVCNHTNVIALFEKIDFPEELVVNRSVKEFMNFMNQN